MARLVVGSFQEASAPAPDSVEDKCWGYSVKMCATDQDAFQLSCFQLSTQTSRDDCQCSLQEEVAGMKEGPGVRKEKKEKKEKTPKDRCAGYSVEMCLIDQQMS